MSYAHYQHGQPGWGTPQVLSNSFPPFSFLISYIVSVWSPSGAHFPISTFLQVLSLSSLYQRLTFQFKQGGAWISIELTQLLLISIRERHLRPTMFHRKSSKPTVLHRSLFDNAWNRVRGYSESMAGEIGVGTHEAKHWHRRAYGGIVCFSSQFLLHPCLYHSTG